MPAMLRSLLWVPGTLILLAVLADLLVTSLKSGEGRLTRLVHTGLYRPMRALSRLVHPREVLAWTPGVLVIGTLLVWIALTWLGWVLIFWSVPGWVVGADEGTQAQLGAVVYFVGFTISTLGLGELRPEGQLPRVLTALAALDGFFLVTFSITFLTPLAQAHGARRELALRIHRAGDTAQQLVLSGWQEHPQGLEGLFAEMASDLVQVDAQHRNAPYLHRFHDRFAEEDVHLLLPALGEALLIAEHGLKGPRLRGLRTLRASVMGMLESFAQVHDSDPPVPPLPDLAALREAGLPLRDDADFAARLEGEAALRRALHAMVRQAGWSWDRVAGTRTPTLSLEAM